MENYTLGENAEHYRVDLHLKDLKPDNYWRTYYKDSPKLRDLEAQEFWDELPEDSKEHVAFQYVCYGSSLDKIKSQLAYHKLSASLRILIAGIEQTAHTFCYAPRYKKSFSLQVDRSKVTSASKVLFTSTVPDTNCSCTCSVREDASSKVLSGTFTFESSYLEKSFAINFEGSTAQLCYDDFLYKLYALMKNLWELHKAYFDDIDTRKRKCETAISKLRFKGKRKDKVEYEVFGKVNKETMFSTFWALKSMSESELLTLIQDICSQYDCRVTGLYERHVGEI